MSEKKKPDNSGRAGSGFSRRGFLTSVGVTGGALTTGILSTEATAEAAPATHVSGPGPVPFTLDINGKPWRVNLEPRTTLCDALRNQLDFTAAKRVCDRGTCGACTVIMDGKSVYSCTVLAIDAQGKKIETLEGISPADHPHPVSTAFVAHDGQQCGYCTPGFVVAAKAFLDQHPNPSEEDVKRGLGGNLCRCGTYMGVREAVLEAAKKSKGGHNA